MFRNLFFLLAAATALSAHAQNTANMLPKTTEKQADPQIDYKIPGTPMPPVRVIVYDDAAGKSLAAFKEPGKPGDSAAKHPLMPVNPNATPPPPENKKKKRKHTEETGDVGQSGILTNKDLDNGANLFMMIFNPTCSHCQDETVNLEKNISLFDKSRLVLVATPGMGPYVADFYTLMHIKDFPQINVGIDSADYVNQTFLYQMLPQINVYDHHRKLIRSFKGDVGIDSLKQYIE